MGSEGEQQLTSVDVESATATAAARTPFRRASGAMDRARHIDVQRDRYPYCIVWTPLHIITWLIPFIGHTGIATSDGITHDFAGPYYVSEDSMAFGRPTKYVQLNPLRAATDTMDWDEAVTTGSKEYRKRMHNLCCDNCHSHVACCLNNMGYGGSRSWNMIKIGIMVTLHSKYVSFGRWLQTWLPFMVMALMIILMAVLM